MNFQDFQRAAVRTANKLDRDQLLTMAALGLAGEAGEVVDYLKKVLYHGHEFDWLEVAKECGDVLWYLAVLAHAAGFDLETAAEMNVAKLRKRYPNGFTTNDSLARVDTVEAPLADNPDNHPYYGPCDGLLPNGSCAECFWQRLEGGK